MNEVFLTVGGTTITGWQTIHVTRGIERMPSSFDISMTECSPADIEAVVVQPGDSCIFSIGYDTVITGWVDRLTISTSEGAHTIRVIGRSKSADIVDCAAWWKNGQITNCDAVTIAKQLSAFYGIAVNNLAGEMTSNVPQIMLAWGESTFDVIERACRWSSVLFYDDPSGNMVISNVGKTKHSGGLAEGVNIQDSELTRSMDQRFSEYHVRRIGVNSFNEMSKSDDLICITYDKGVTRKRLRIINHENGAAGEISGKKRGEWEAARRLGRSKTLRITTDTWRDKDGTLWTPNQLVDVTSPTLKTVGEDWIISEVSYLLDEQGTRAELVLMPPQAFVVEPILPWDRKLGDIKPGIGAIGAGVGTGPGLGLGSVPRPTRGGQ